MSRVGDLFLIGGMAILLCLSVTTVTDAVSQHYLDRTGREVTRKMQAHYRQRGCTTWECLRYEGGK